MILQAAVRGEGSVGARQHDAARLDLGFHLHGITSFAVCSTGKEVKPSSLLPPGRSLPVLNQAPLGESLPIDTFEVGFDF
jgi:hypothetical protein